MEGGPSRGECILEVFVAEQWNADVAEGQGKHAAAIGLLEEDGDDLHGMGCGGDIERPERAPAGGEGVPMDGDCGEVCTREANVGGVGWVWEGECVRVHGVHGGVGGIQCAGWVQCGACGVGETMCGVCGMRWHMGMGIIYNWKQGLTGTERAEDCAGPAAGTARQSLLSPRTIAPLLSRCRAVRNGYALPYERTAGQDEDSGTEGMGSRGTRKLSRSKHGIQTERLQDGMLIYGRQVNGSARPFPTDVRERVVARGTTNSLPVVMKVLLCRGTGPRGTSLLTSSPPSQSMSGDANRVFWVFERPQVGTHMVQSV